MRVASLTDGMMEIEDTVTSNFDYEINQEIVEQLRSSPNTKFSYHAAWDFNGRVWFDGSNFREEIWRYGVPKEVISAPTVEELRDEANAKWGTG